MFEASNWLNVFILSINAYTCLKLLPPRGGGVLGDAREGLPPLPLGLALPEGLALPIGLPTPTIGEGGEGLWDPLSPLQPPPSGDPDSSLKKIEK